MLAGYASPLYDELYADWHRLDIAVLRPSANHSNARSHHAVEVIWSNRPLAGQIDLLAPQVCDG